MPGRGGGRARGGARRARPRHEFHLSTNYRNSAEIYDFAAAYAERVGLDADLPDAVRVDRGRARGAAPVDDLASRRSASAVTELAGAVEGTVGDRRAGRPPRARCSRLALAGWPTTLADAAARRRQRWPGVVVLTGLDTKGLEFDGIVVVAPEEIEAESATGRATLYVVSPAPPSGMITLTT